jgi:hypothetical protein
MRQLATIQKVVKVDNILGKDRIGLASFAGVNWKVICQKNLPVNTLVCFVEYDSILPELPCFETLRKRCYSQKYRGFVIKPMKFKLEDESYVVSYGILFEKDDLKDIIFSEKWNTFKEGDDITDIIGIRKVEDEVPNEMHLFQKKSFFQRLHDKIIYKLFHIKTNKTGGWPKWASRSDETRVEAFGSWIFEDAQDMPIYSTVKVDGQSALFGIYKNTFYICSRNNLVYKKDIKSAIKDLSLKNIVNVRKYSSAFCVSASIYELPKKFKEARKQLGFDFYIQCEQAGPGIQGNKLNLKDFTLFIFNYYNISKECFYSWEDIFQLSVKLEIPTVPFIKIDKWNFKDLKECKEFAKGSYDSGYAREGVVIRAYVNEGNPMPPPLRGMSNQWSLKVINDEYILQ